jgi:phosphoglycolate phosphatase-like HAD superfamily hydrolase
MLIVFDVDGTLVDATEVDNKCFDDAFLDVTGVPLPGERWDRISEFTAAAIVREALHDWPEARVKAVEGDIRAAFLARLNAVHAADPQAFPPVPGGPALIAELLTGDAVRLAIATGCWRDTSRFKLAAAGYRLDGIEFASSSDCYRRVDIIRTVMRQAGVGTSDTVYVGDQLWDYRAATELGVRFIGVGRVRERLRSAGATIIDGSLSAQALMEAVGRQGQTTPTGR